METKYTKHDANWLIGEVRLLRLENKRLREENKRLKAELGKLATFAAIHGVSGYTLEFEDFEDEKHR